jgi:osmotically-inducible protein OsmY
MSSILHRPDVDIEEEIHQVITTFAPLKASRPYFTFHSEGGKVVFHGNVRNPQARMRLIDNVTSVNGVTGVDVADLFDDEVVLFEVAGLLPPGVFATVHFGTAILSGELPAGTSIDALTKALEAVPGVRRIATDFS